MSRRSRIPFGLAALGLWLFGPAGDAASPPSGPIASARAFAVRVVPAGQAGVSTPLVVSPPNAQGFLDGFQYPADSSIVQTGAITVTTSSGTTPTGGANAAASSDVAGVSLFKGEITADAISGRAKAAAAARAADGDANGAGLTNLVVLGQQVSPAPNLRIQLADWGYADLLVESSKDGSSPTGAKTHETIAIALDVHLTADHGGLASGSELQIGFAQADAQAAPPAPPAPKPPVAGPVAGASGIHDEHPGAKRKTRAKSLKQRAHEGGLALVPPLDAGPYVFPVFGPVSYGDSFGGPRSDVSGGWHHGDDIFGSIGQPLLAVADGTLFDVGFQKIGGYRLWLRDRQGNQFYYAHLSAYAGAARNGAHVKAGAVIGFMGTTGDAFGALPHLHFEVHPVSLLFLGYDGAVNPTSYLNSWSHLDEVKFPNVAGWAPPIRGSVRAPEPGAILLGSSDISTADGLDPASLNRALTAPIAQLGSSPEPTGLSPFRKRG